MSNKAVTDFIKAAVNDKPIEAASAFDQIMQPKISDAIETSATEFKQGMFNTPETNQEDEQ